jgi:hypothetical protein
MSTQLEAEDRNNGARVTLIPKELAERMLDDE